MSTVKCENCDAEISEETASCPYCGTQAELAETTAEESFCEVKTGAKSKKLIAAVIAAAIVLTVAAVSVFNIVFKPEKGEAAKEYPAKYDEYKASIEVFENIKFDGKLLNYQSSMDGTKMFALVRERPDEHGGTLYFIDSESTDNKHKISEGVGESFRPSASGNAVVYTKPDFSTYPVTAAELWLYSDGENIKLGDNFAYGLYKGLVVFSPSLAISPDGKTVAFVIIDDGEHVEYMDRYMGFIWSNGELHELGRRTFPIAVSDNAEYVYYNTDTNVLYVQAGVDANDVVKLGDGMNTRFYFLYFNKDLSQLVYICDSKVHLSRNGGGGKPLTDGSCEFIFPQKISQMRYGGIWGVDDFSNTFYRNTDGDIIRINSSYNAEIVARNFPSRPA